MEFKAGVLAIIIFFVATVIFLLHYTIVGQAVYGDGRYYWANAHSIYFDRDLDLRNQLRHQWNPENNNKQKPEENFESEAYLGHPLGTGLFWLPGMLIADLFAHGAGYADIYQVTVGLSVIALVSAGLYLLGKSVSSIALLFLFLTTNLFYYGTIDVLNSHPISFFLSSLFLYLFLRWEKMTGKRWLIIGLLSGLIFSVREQDILTILPLLVYMGIRRGGQTYFVFLGFLGGYFPQLYYRLIYAGSAISPWFSPKMWHLTDPKIFPLFFGRGRGILLYSPSLALALWGLISGKKILYRLTLVSFILQIVLISVWWAWDQGEAYGVRMLITTYPFLAYGYDEVIKKAERFLRPSTMTKILVVLTFLNLLMMIKFLLGSTGIDGGGIDPTTQIRIDKLIRFVARFWSN